MVFSEGVEAVAFADKQEEAERRTMGEAALIPACEPVLLVRLGYLRPGKRGKLSLAVERAEVRVTWAALCWPISLYGWSLCGGSLGASGGFRGALGSGAAIADVHADDVSFL